MSNHFTDLLNKNIGNQESTMVNKPVNQSKHTLYSEWRNDPNNTWPVGTDLEFKEFKEHAIRVSGRLTSDTLAYQMGYPRPTESPQAATSKPQQPVKPDKVSKPIKQPKSADRGYTSVLAGLLGVESRAIEAVIDIESGGRAFANDGKPITRFELHVFLNSLTNAEKDEASRNFRVQSGRPAWHNDAQLMNIGNEQWRKIHTGSQEDEWQAISMAALVNRDKAFRACSYGAFQIMGFHYAKLFYDSAESMYHGFAVSEAVQAWGFICFIMSNRSMLNALRRGDYDEFARYYNGSGQAARYGRLIRDRIRRNSHL